MKLKLSTVISKKTASEFRETVQDLGEHVSSHLHWSKVYRNLGQLTLSMELESYAVEGIRLDIEARIILIKMEHCA